MNALTFADPADYEKVCEGDQISLLNLRDFAPGRPVTMRLMHRHGGATEFLLKHSYSLEHIEWFKAGSALNFIRDGRR